MGENNRTRSSMRNSIVALLCKVLVLLLSYVARMILVRTLDVACVGANGLLSSILIPFSLGSLGIDSALVFLLYAPVAAGDLGKQRTLMRACRRIHLAAAAAIAVIAAVLYVLMPIISPEAAGIPAFPLVYWLFAGNIIAGYLCSHKQMLFLADQRDFINELFEFGQTFLQYSIQILVLILTKSFVLYTLVFFVLILVRNLTAAAYANRRYPQLKEKAEAALPPEEKHTLGRNLFALLIRNAGWEVISVTDTLLLSAYYGIVSMARYANYTLILKGVTALFNRLINGIMGSVGNLGATSDKTSVENVYNASLMISFSLCGMIAICLFECIDLLIRLSFGAEYVCSAAIVLVLCVNFYLKGIRVVTNLFRTSLGLFWNARFLSLIEAGFNLVFSLGAMAVFHEPGIFIGTTLSMLAVPVWMEPRVLYREYFGKSLSVYFLRAGAYTLMAAVCGIFAHLLCGLIGGPVLLRLVLRAIVSIVVSAGIMILAFHKTKEYKLLCSAFLSVLHKT